MERENLPNVFLLPLPRRLRTQNRDDFSQKETAAIQKASGRRDLGERSKMPSGNGTATGAFFWKKLDPTEQASYLAGVPSRENQLEARLFEALQEVMPPGTFLVHGAENLDIDAFVVDRLPMTLTAMVVPLQLKSYASRGRGYYGYPCVVFGDPAEPARYSKNIQMHTRCCSSLP